MRRLVAAIVLFGVLACAPRPAYAPHVAHTAMPSEGPAADDSDAPAATFAPVPAVDTATWRTVSSGVRIGVRRFSVFGALSAAMLAPELTLALAGHASIRWLDPHTARVAAPGMLALVSIDGRDLTVVQSPCDSPSCESAVKDVLASDDPRADTCRYLTLGSDTSLALPSRWHVLDPRSGRTLLDDSAGLAPDLRSAVADRIGFSLDGGDAYYPPATLLLYAVATDVALDGHAVALDLVLQRYARAVDQTIDSFASTAPARLDVRKVTTATGEALEVTRDAGGRHEIDEILFIGDSSYVFRFSASDPARLDRDAFRAIAGSLVPSTVLVSPPSP